MPRWLPAALPAVLLIAAAPAEPRSDKEADTRVCFLPQTITNYRTLRDTTVYVRDLRGQVFEIQTSGCRGLALSRTFGISPSTGSSACVGEGVTVLTMGPSLRGENNSVCSARVMRRLDAAQIAALPGRVRP